ncbi:MAG: CvpA family protein [Clostridia bacterium]|nr:CvpA family protein [Clostridia bacterium]
MLNGLNASTVNSILDIIAIVVFLIFGFIAARKGFVDCIFGMVSTILAVVLAFLLINTVTNLTGGLFGLQNMLINGCIEGFAKIKGFDIDISTGGLTAALQEKNLPNFLVKIIVDGVGNKSIPAGTTLAKIVGGTIGELAGKLIIFLILFALLKLILSLLRNVVSSIVENLPLVNGLNRLLGFAVGVVQGFLIVCVVIAVVSVIPSQGIVNFFNQSAILKFIYNKNPIHTILGWVIN